MNWQILLVSEVIVQYHPSILRIFHKRILPWKEKRTSPNQTPGTSVLGLPGLLQPPVLLGSPAILLPPLPLRLVFLSQDPASPLSFPELLCLGIASKSWHAWLDRVQSQEAWAESFLAGTNESAFYLLELGRLVVASTSARASMEVLCSLPGGKSGDA